MHMQSFKKSGLVVRKKEKKKVIEEKPESLKASQEIKN